MEIALMRGDKEIAEFAWDYLQRTKADETKHKRVNLEVIRKQIAALSQEIQKPIDYPDFFKFLEKCEDTQLPEETRKYQAYLSEGSQHNPDKIMADFLNRRIRFKGLRSSNQPIHDALIDALLPPDDAQWDKAAWREYMEADGAIGTQPQF